MGSENGFTRRGFVSGSVILPLVAHDAVTSAKAEQPSTIDPRKPVATWLTVNGRNVQSEIDPRSVLLDALRETLDLTGTKKGCDHGQCGACTVLVDGRRVLSCLTLTLSVQGKDIQTIEGMEKGDDLHPMQQAFIDNDAFQCGYCTPGQIMSAVGCVNEGHAGSDDEIREYMSGNLCRCAAYPNIVDAVRQAALQMSSERKAG
jgi:xanthine dehydrogenase YagT iron-sulfur-binding subunit